MIQAIPINSYFLIKKCLKSFQKKCASVLFSHWDADLFACILLSLYIMFLPFSIFCSYVILSFQTPCPLVYLFTCLLVHLQQATYITTYIFLAIGILVLYLCIVIRNEGMTKGNFYKPNNL